MVELSLDLDRVGHAAVAIPSPFVRSPQYRSEGLSRLLGLELVLKVETVNPTGTVASRGAEWWFECHPDVHRVVCPSADDFGVAMAHAGRARGIEVELFGPIHADPAKVEALRHSGTMVWLDGHDDNEIRAEARRYSTLVDGLVVDEDDQLEFAEGAATMAAELESLAIEFDSIFVPGANGSLAHGTGAWCHTVMPRTRVVGVDIESAPSVVSVSGSEAPTSPVAGSLDDTTTVHPRHLEQAAAALLVHEGIRVSPDGSAALAAAALAAPDMRGARVVVPVTGRGIG